MNDDNINPQNDKDISELIQMSTGSKQAPHISSGEVEDKLKSKISEIEEKKKEEITEREAAALGVGYIFLKGFPLNPEALILIPEEEAIARQVVSFFKTDEEIRVGALNPTDPAVTELVWRLETDTRTHGAVYKISSQSLQYALGMYRTIPKLRKYAGGIEIGEADLIRYQGKISSFKDIAERILHVSATDLLTAVLAGAIQANSSDVHIEAEQDDVKIRYRVDGVLYDVASLPKKDWPKIINRVKLIAKLKINVTDIPQDGRFTIYLTEEFIDVRVSTIPSAYGESIVMRLLMSSTTGFGLEELGLVGDAYETVKREIERPNGMILNTGPTGSGKTTTLYAILKKLNTASLKIITLENPIEYRLKGIIQSQVEISDSAESKIKKSGEAKRLFTYANGLKSVLRQDPDVGMVGEIRDQETADIAIQAALTGHLLLSTLHTNSSAGAIPRLISMSVKPFLLAPSLNCVIGQRLVRKICVNCQEAYTPDEPTLKRVDDAINSIPEAKRQGLTRATYKFLRGKGCESCNGIGYKGRIGIFEILTMNKGIENLILNAQSSENQIREVAQKNGMLTMLQDGMIKACQGMTTPDEVFRVIS